MKKYNIICPIVILILCFTMSSCKKQDDFLNVKREKLEVVPTTIADAQAILDEPDYSNYDFPTFGYAGIDNNKATDAQLGTLDNVQRAAYFWNKDIYPPTFPAYDWDIPYQSIETFNIALDVLKKVTVSPANQLQYNNAEGSALFYRSFYFYSLAQLFCKAYDNNTATSDLGIVLRLTSDVNVKSTRSTVQQTYDQMINDLKQAISLLPVHAAFSYRPSQISANALLAKVYLSMGDYANASHYATASLNQFNTLLDFNSNLIHPSGGSPFPAYPNNPEISFFAYAQQGEGVYFSVSGVNFINIDTALYNLYEDNDLRKSLFYYVQSPGNVFFQGSYAATFYAFSGIATNEVYLINAESKARLADISGALSDLNTLLSKRYKTGTFVPVAITDPTVLLTKILQERRKELPFTGQLRWEDLRRLNKDPRFAVTLTRVSGGVTYTLPPNDPRYVLPIPPTEIQLSGIPQNPR